MLNLKSFIKITQQGNKNYPNRSDTFTFDFVNSVEVVSTWENLADTAEIVMPHNLQRGNCRSKWKIPEQDQRNAERRYIECG